MSSNASTTRCPRCHSVGAHTQGQCLARETMRRCYRAAYSPVTAAGWHGTLTPDGRIIGRVYDSHTEQR